MLGIVQLARTTDKAKAVAHGNIGEYRYDSSVDQGLFEYLHIDPKEFLDVVKGAKNDSEIEACANTFVSKKDPRSIEASIRSGSRQCRSGNHWCTSKSCAVRLLPARPTLCLGRTYSTWKKAGWFPSARSFKLSFERGARCKSRFLV